MGEEHENDDYQTKNNVRLLSGTNDDNNKQKEQVDTSGTENKILQNQDQDGKKEKQELINDSSGYQSIDMLYSGKVHDGMRKGEASSVIAENMEELEDEKNLNDVASNQEKNSSKDNVFIYQVVSFEAKPTDQMALSPKGSSFAIDKTKDLLKDIRISETIPVCGVDESFEVLAEPIECTLNNETNEHIIRMNNFGSNRSQSGTRSEIEHVESNKVIEYFDSAVANEQYIANEAQFVNEDLPEVNNKGKEDPIVKEPDEQGEYEYSHNDKADTEPKNTQTLASNETADAFLEKARRANAIGPKLGDAQSIDDKTDVTEEKKKKKNELCAIEKTRQW